MHPNTFYAKHFNQAKRDEAFVIMSFASEFTTRWELVIEPCLRDDVKLIPRWVDYNTSGESIVHDILDGIAHARIVVADITSSPMRDAAGHLWPQRNGNVMWEVGIAHTMRLPDEVIMVRSDDEPSIFDLTQFRAFPYDPSNVSVSRRFLSTLVNDRLRSIDQSASEYVRQCAESLSFPEWNVLLTTIEKGCFDPPIIRNMGEVMSNSAVLPAISRLLEMGALRTSFISVTPKLLSDKTTLDTTPFERLFRYEPTALGVAIVKHAGREMNMDSPSVSAAWKSLSDPSTSPAAK